ncbi:hypothetical protein CVT24_013016 [Panaeolus cyanescens]|uniref:Uncharacterized protein n=1 Tax=Panaeolus cyanescens TaxID=181874 RepID=A0A409WQZ7_9AGAR|nr:hypothetical protein CVT24_013016 [Panaeolus cyanescens]
MSSSTSPPQTQDSQPSTSPNALSNPQLDDTTQEPDIIDNSTDSSNSRPFRVYTKQELLYLSYSQMVQCPSSMPELKVWFGSETDNLLKKDEPQTPNTARERRFRRDGEEGDSSSRLPYRPNVSQPMGNFKHQSLRPNDRDRDRDGEREKDRDTRDKEGLRHLSDKYDRDRLAMPPASSRNKERETAPHLTSNSRSAQPMGVNGPSRRTDGRDVSKKKIGEAGEDWRRGAEPPRASRDEQAGRRDREDRERPRSRVRDSSRHKRDSSTTRRDREKDRDEHRREKDDTRRDREPDEDDARRWRDDGKREERMASRRTDRARDRNGEHWEHVQDRRWPAGDDRDARYKRTAVRDRKGNGNEDMRDKDDRKDRDRKEEKEPAWMDTYVPSESTPGILGGASIGGELDGIQAWKKGMKEKETKEKEASLPLASQEGSSLPTEPTVERPAMDEIQLFKMLMKQEEEKKRLEDNGGAVTTSESVPKPPAVHAERNAVEALSQTSKALDRMPASTDASFIASTPQDLHAPEKVINLADLPSERTISRLASITTPQDSHPPASSTFQPSAGPRLLNLGRTSQKPTVPAGQLIDAGKYIVFSVFALYLMYITDPLQLAKAGPPRTGFSPFDDPNRHVTPIDETKDANLVGNVPQHVPQRPNAEAPYRTNLPPINDIGHNGAVASKGSRFAKFFDEKARDGQQPVGKSPMQVPTNYPIPSPVINQRPDPSAYGLGHLNGNPNDQRTMEDIFAMLSSSSQQRGNMVPSHPPSLVNNPNIHFSNSQAPHAGNLQQHVMHQQPHQPRLEPLYDSRNEDRSFVPDGMVPGLRPLPPPIPRRETLGHFSDHVEDPAHFTLQRLLAQQQQQQQQQSRNIDSPLYAGANSSFGQTGRHVGHPLQGLHQPHYRGGPSPGINQTAPSSNLPHPQQRLPPGLANLGGRPPHEPNQFIGLQNLPTTSSHNMHLNAPQAQQQLPFTGFNNAAGFNNQNRPNLPGSHVPNLPQHALNGLNIPNIDPRLSATHPLLALNGSNVAGNRMNGGFPPAPTATPHMLRPQQQQQSGMHPQMLPHLLPPHLHQQTHPVPSNQPAHDLMALLMGGTHRE